MAFNTAKKLIVLVNVTLLMITMFSCKSKCKCDELTNGGKFYEDKHSYKYWQIDTNFIMLYSFDNNKKIRAIAVYNQYDEKGVQLTFISNKLEVISQTGFKPNKSIDVDSLNNDYVKTY